VSLDLQHLLLNLLCRDPDERLTSKDVLAHKYFADLRIQKSENREKDSSECLDFLMTTMVHDGEVNYL